MDEDMSIGKIDSEEGKDKEINSSEDKPQNKPNPTVNAVCFPELWVLSCP